MQKVLYKTISPCICKQVVASGRMINVSPIKTFDHELTRETKVLTDPQGFLVYIFGRKIFSNTAIVCIRELCCVDLIIEEIIDIHIIHIALNRL